MTLRKITLFIIPAAVLFSSVFFTQDFVESIVADKHTVAYAADDDLVAGPTDTDDDLVSGDPTDSSGCDPSNGELCNPLQSESIEEFLVKIVEVLIIFAVPIIVLFIMYAGFLFVTARGDVEQIKTARRALLWAVVGGVIALGAKLIITVIQGTIKGF